jgi:C-terminal processing protease CtpA/Prc
MKSVSLHVGLLLPVAAVSAFVSPSAVPQTTRSTSSFIFRQDALRRYASVESEISPESSSQDDATEEDNTIDPPSDIFPTAEFLTFELADHRPLGCTVEETLFEDENYVFISKVVPGGFAEQAGIQTGDVLFAITGLFRRATPVLEVGVDKM